MKHQNLVFLPSSNELRKDLFSLGLDFILVRIKEQLHFMIVTNQLRLIQELSREHKINQFYTSDSRRQIHEVVFMSHGSYDYEPFKLGQLSKKENGKPFLVVTEDSKTYHYFVE